MAGAAPPPGTSATLKSWKRTDSALPSDDRVNLYWISLECRNLAPITGASWARVGSGAMKATIVTTVATISADGNRLAIFCPPRNLRGPFRPGRQVSRGSFARLVSPTNAGVDRIDMESTGCVSALPAQHQHNVHAEIGGACHIEQNALHVRAVDLDGERVLALAARLRLLATGRAHAHLP